MTRVGFRVNCAVAALVSLAPAASAQTVSDSRVKELMGAALAQLQPGTPASAQTSPAADGVDLKLDDAVRAALEKNLDIAVERLNPPTYDLTIAALRSVFKPTITSTIGQNNVVQLPTSQLVGGQQVSNDTTTFNTGVSQALPWGGGSFSALWNNRRQESTSNFNTFNPQYNSTFSGTFVQPLLRGFTTDSTRTQLRVTALNREISELQLRATVTNTLANVRNAYWDLVYAVQAVEVAHRSLALAEKLIEDNRVRVEVGTMAPIDVVQAEAEAATRRQAVAVAEATWRTAELALKRLIVSGTGEPLWHARINPVDRPSFGREPVDLEGAIRRALEKRTDLAQAQRNVQMNELNVRLLRDQTLPAADFVATYGLQGIGGTRFERGTGLGSPIIGTIPGGFSDALRALSNRDYPNWNLQVQLSYPIGTSAAEAQYARARLQVQQTQAQIKQLELQVATEVTNIALQVESNLKRLEAAQAARELAEKRLDAETSKFEVGMSTNFFVVQAQRDLSDAQNAELRALLDYRKSLVDFERVQDTAVSRAGIAVVSPGSGTASVGSGRTASTTGGGGTGGTGGQGQQQER